jgi:hypothetical protein
MKGKRAARRGKARGPQGKRERAVRHERQEAREEGGPQGMKGRKGKRERAVRHEGEG